LINSDEEIGSIGSEPLFRESAKRNHLGLIFEPSFADSAIVSSRKGSTNFSIVARGKAAHAGRDFDKGRNAILALARYIVAATELNDPIRGISINPGYISGGGPVNIVTDLALCRFNARAVESNDFASIKIKLEKLINKISGDGIELSFHMESDRAPKVFDEKCRHLFDMIDQCAQEEGYSLILRPSGGVCDGNILAEEGMAVIDTLGAIGGNIHTMEEYILIESLVQRSRLVGLFLIKLATGSLTI
jgi:glutamate carboxypeptidase